MRDLLTGLAIILIVALTTILVAPYFVDWNGQRGFLEARLSHAVGQKVTIGGGIDLKLLPTPYLVLDQVVVGADDGPVRISAHHLDLELTVAPLFHGEFDIVEARLEEPTIRLTLTHDRALPVLPPAPAFEADVRFDRIHVIDGTLAIADPTSGRSFVFDHLDFDADAGSLTGPFKVEGAGGASDARTKFRLATAPPEQGKAHARFVVDETSLHAGLELDGMVDLSAAQSDAIRQSFLGTFVASGHVAREASDPIAWKLSGPLKADPDTAVLAGGELKLGGEDASLRLQADATLDLTVAPKLAIDVAAKQLDIDRLSGAPVDAVRPPPPRLPSFTEVARLLAGVIPPVPTKLDLSIDTATYGGEALGAIQAHLGAEEGGKQPLKLNLDGPGGSHLGLDGHIATRDTARYIGAAGFSAEDLDRLGAWLARVAPNGSPAPGTFGLKSARVDARVALDADGIDAEKLKATLDRSEISGAIRLIAARGTQPMKVDADIAASTLDFDELPSLASARATLGAIDLKLSLSAKASRVRTVGNSDLASGPFTARITKTSDRITVENARVENLGDATVTGSGTIDSDKIRVAMGLEARKMDAAADIFRRLFPGAAAEALVARAGTLAPARLNIEATFPVRVENAIPSVLSASGTMGATRIEARMNLDANADDAITATLDAPEGITLLRQLVPDAAPVGTIGQSRIRLIAKGRSPADLDVTLVAQLGATHAELAGGFNTSVPRPKGSGTLRLKSPDLTPILQSLAISVPDLINRVPAEATGTLAVSEDAVRLDGFSGQIDDVTAKGSVAWRTTAGRDETPTLTGNIEAERISSAGLVGLILGHPQGVDEGARWSREPFSGGLVEPPRTALSMKVRAFDIEPGVTAHDATFDLGLGPNVMTLTHMKADLAGGRAEAEAIVRRDGPRAGVEGKISLDNVALRLGDIRARLTGKVDFAGGGESAWGLMSSLAGSGDATAADLSIPRADPASFRKVFQDVENDTLSVDQDVVVRALDDNATAPALVTTKRYRLDLAAGVLHASPAEDHDTGNAAVAISADGSFDLTRGLIDLKVAQTLHALPKNWAGPPPSITIRLTGAADNPTRRVDVSNFLNAVASRALTRETARIEAYEFDIRERAFFNTRLQSEARRVDERQKAEDDAKKAEADRKARLEAARLDRQRREAAAKAARAAEEQRRQSGDTPNPSPQGAPRAPSGQDPSTLGRY